MPSEILLPTARTTDADGNPYAGAKWYFYTTGTSTPLNVYADADLSTSLGATVTADAGGKFVSIYFDASLSYRGVLENASGSVTLHDIDPINDAVLAQIQTLIDAVQDGVFVAGNATASLGNAKVRWERDSSVYPIQNEAGLWVNNVVFDHALSSDFGASDGTVGGPVVGLVSVANNTGTPADVVAILSDAIVRENDGRACSLNAIARNAAAVTNSTLYVAEFDWTPSAGTTVASDSGAVFINAFNLQCPVGIQFGGVGGGNFAIGIAAYGIDDNGSFLVGGASETMGTFINTTASTFNEAAIKIGANQRFKLDGTGGSTYAQIYNPSNALFLVADTNGVVVRNNTDTTNNVIFDNSGNVDAVGVYKVDGVQVVSNRDTGWATQTASASKANLGASPTVGQLASWAAAVDAALKAHGLFGA